MGQNLDERCRAFVRLCANECKGCFRRGTAACVTCPFQSAQGLLRDIETGFETLGDGYHGKKQKQEHEPQKTGRKKRIYGRGSALPVDDDGR